ncbi:MAG: bifunctional folylpolyglutamate synthase/dihydrofolate synthase [Blautia sp.]
MNYKESRAYIDQVECYGRVLGLENIEELMRRLGNPQNDLKFIHAAGTNGKGSTLAYISTVLQEAGYRVGRYISPTLYSYRERMAVGEKKISREAFARHLTKVADVAEKMAAEGRPHPTPFEIETAVAFLYFQEEACDLVALETGMGGATDATNVVSSTLLAVLTPVGMDHMGFLGDTLSEIAQVKAGIIKPGCVAVSAHQQPEAAAVVERTCARVGVPLVWSKEEDYQVEEASCLHTLSGGEAFQTSLAGVYQIDNAAWRRRSGENWRDWGIPFPGGGKERIETDSLERPFHSDWSGAALCGGRRPQPRCGPEVGGVRQGVFFRENALLYCGNVPG